MLDAKAREALEGVSRFLGGAIGRTGVSPNALTVAGVGITAFASWQVLEDNRLAAAAILSAGSVFDFLDGSVARVTGKSSMFGAFLDSVTDRLADALILGALLWAFIEREDRLAAALTLAAFIAAQLVPYVRAKAESLGMTCNVGFVERAERILLLIVGLAVGSFVPVALSSAIGILAVLSVVTAVQRLVHVGRQARAAA